MLINLVMQGCSRDSEQFCGLEHNPAFQSVGYRQLGEHLDGTRTLADAVESIQTEHRHYARRQLVWFRADPNIDWLPAPVDVDRLAERYLRIPI